MVKNESTKCQSGKLMVWFLKYYPVRIKNVGEEQKAARQTIWDFKDGRSYEEVAQMTAERLKEQFGDGLKDIVFSCIPASSAEKNELRYKRFSERVCELAHTINGYPHIQVSGERMTVHDHRKNEQEARNADIVSFDKSFFSGKKVLLFDDVISKGISYANIANRLEQFGAEVLGGFFLGKTFYKVR